MVAKSKAGNDPVGRYISQPLDAGFFEGYIRVKAEIDACARSQRVSAHLAIRSACSFTDES